jgi:hypothetical protein
MLPFQQAAPSVLFVAVMAVLLLPSGVGAAELFVLLFQRHQSLPLLLLLLGSMFAVSACVMQVTVLKLLLTTWQAIPPTRSAVTALLPGKAEFGKPLPLTVTRVPPARLPVLGLTEST